MDGGPAKHGLAKIAGIPDHWPVITVEEAQKKIEERLAALGTEEVSIESCLQRVSAEALHSDRDLPPFNRSTFDGIAISSDAVDRGVRRFPIAGTAFAGSPQTRLPDNGSCIEIMTGAPVPKGADCVIKIEDTRLEDEVARLRDGLEVEAGIGIHPQGSDSKSGQRLLERGRRMTAKEIAIAASIGKSTLLVYREPRIAIITTGDELIDISASPEPHQIRRSNDLTLEEALRSAGYGQAERFHLADDRGATETFVRRALDHYDVLILAGGVSKGKRDFLPEALESAGVEKAFQWVSQRPGKPLWFGDYRRRSNPVYVFALPGNPVSCFTCLHRYAIPALNRICGLGPSSTAFAKLSGDFRFEPELTLFLPALLSVDETGQRWAQPLPFNTSGDFISVAQTQGFLELPADRSRFAEGEAFPFHPWSG